MNSFILPVVIIGVVAIFATTSAQDSCGCAPQPTVIQLSCGGGNGQLQRPPHHPPPPPAFNPGTPSWSGDSPAGGEDDPMDMCRFDENGFPISHPPGGFPEGFQIIYDSDGFPRPRPNELYPLPPDNWDGRMETLGFPMPQPGTPHYNMLMCIPIPVTTAGK